MGSGLVLRGKRGQNSMEIIKVKGGFGTHGKMGAPGVSLTLRGRWSPFNTIIRDMRRVIIPSRKGGGEERL